MLVSPIPSNPQHFAAFPKAPTLTNVKNQASFPAIYYLDESESTCRAMLRRRQSLGQGTNIVGILSYLSRHHQLYNERNDRVGAIMMEQLWAEEHLSRPRAFKFMLVSRSENVFPFLPHIEIFDSQRFEKGPWCFLNIMMIQMSEEEQMAERLGVGIIHEDGWMDASPRSMFVKLR